MRSRQDGWRPIAGLVRALIDLGRYADPRYADAPALRARMARKLTDHVRTARAIDPLTRSLTLRLIRRVQSDTDAKLSRRLVSRLGAVERAIPTARSWTTSCASGSPTPCSSPRWSSSRAPRSST